jgi:hypothetical protein
MFSASAASFVQKLFEETEETTTCHSRNLRQSSSSGPRINADVDPSTGRQTGADQRDGFCL